MKANNMNLNLNLSSLDQTRAEIEYYKRNGTCSTTSLMGDVNNDTRAYATDRHHHGTITPPFDKQKYN